MDIDTTGRNVNSGLQVKIMIKQLMASNITDAKLYVLRFVDRSSTDREVGVILVLFIS